MDGWTQTALSSGLAVTISLYLIKFITEKLYNFFINDCFNKMGSILETQKTIIQNSREIVEEIKTISETQKEILELIRELKYSSIQQIRK